MIEFNGLNEELIGPFISSERRKSLVGLAASASTSAGKEKQFQSIQPILPFWIGELMDCCLSFPLRLTAAAALALRLLFFSPLHQSTKKVNFLYWLTAAKKSCTPCCLACFLVFVLFFERSCAAGAAHNPPKKREDKASRASSIENQRFSNCGGITFIKKK